MNYLGVDNWDAVLAMFEAGGKFASAWGFLEVLRQAELGDIAGVEKIMHPDEGWWETTKLLFGAFTEENGRLMLQLEDSDAVVAADLIGMIGSNLGQDAIFKLNRRYVTNNKHYHIRIEDEIDWVEVGFDAAGIGADLISFGAGGRIIQGVQVGKKAEQLGNALNVANTFYTFGTAVRDGYVSEPEFIDIVMSGMGFIPYVGTALDVINLFDALLDVSP